jgi:hypothetical protein
VTSADAIELLARSRIRGAVDRALLRPPVRWIRKLGSFALVSTRF